MSLLLDIWHGDGSTPPGQVTAEAGRPPTVAFVTRGRGGRGGSMISHAFLLEIVATRTQPQGGRVRLGRRRIGASGGC